MKGRGLGPGNVICIKWGTKYPTHYVNRLYAGVRRNLARPLRFVCVTDDPAGLADGIEAIALPDEPFHAALDAALAGSRRQGALRKVSIFRPGLVPDLEGPLLGLDLDVAITGPLDPFFEHEPGRICMRRDWLEARRGRPTGHGSVVRFDPARHGYLYDEFAEDPAGRFAWAKASEQKYTSWTALAHEDLAYFPNDWVASFKRDCMLVPPANLLFEPRRPRAARIVCFHGRPKMEEAVAGYAGGVLRRTRPCRWLERAWGGAAAGA